MLDECGHRTQVDVLLDMTGLEILSFAYICSKHVVFLWYATSGHATYHELVACAHGMIK
jgi:hypothetical protein